MLPAAVFCTSDRSAGTQESSPQVTWSRPYVELFGETSDSNYGWHWLSSDTELPVIGQGFRAQEYAEASVASTVSREYGNGTTVGLDRSSGETLWSHDSVSDCSGASGLALVDDVVITCRFNSGRAEHDWDGAQVTESRWEDMDIDLIGLDPETGKEVWTLPLGDEPANYGPSREDGSRPFVIGTDLFATVDGVSVTVDAATGIATPFPENARLLCRAESEETVPLTGPNDVDTLVDYPVAAPKEMCGPDGKPLTDQAVGRAALEIAGYDLGRPIALNLDCSIVVFEAPDPSPRKEKGVRALDKGQGEASE